MPKIVIKEYDNTTAGIQNYANFAVVVPGPCYVDENGNFPKEFDENGIFECNTKADFVRVIGGGNFKNLISADSLVLKELILPTEQRVTYNPDASVVIDEYHTTQSVQDLEEDGTPKVDAEGNPVYKTTEDGEIVTEIVFNDALFQEHIETEKLCVRVSNTWDKTPGEFTSAEYIYNQVKAGDEFDEEACYVLLDKIGQDKQEWAQYGCQIAYELLGLGYPILYKGFKYIKAAEGVEADSDVALLEDESWWECLKDKATYDFRYIINGLIADNATVNNIIIKLANCINDTASIDSDLNATGRGDCIALVDIDANTYLGKPQKNAIMSIVEESTSLDSSTFAAYFAPVVTYTNATMMKEPFCNATFPASFHYLACAARAKDTFNEWYAIAGYTRGISNYSIKSTGCKFGEDAVNLLEPRFATKVPGTNYSVDKAINLVIKIKNSYYLWGNRTAAKLNDKDAEIGDLTAQHFLNIRQLCTTLKKQIYVACRKFTFDPNSDVLWINFCNAIRPTLEKMKSDQGISDYKIIKVTNSRKALLTAKVRIVPIEAVEDFEINIHLEDAFSGAITSEE